LTEDQVEQINEHQRQVDKPFGDLAVEMNLMTAAQVEEVLTFQKNNYLFLGDALLELGHVTDDVLERELLVYKEEQSRYSLAEVFVPDDCGQPELVKVCVDLSRKMFSRVAGLMVRVGIGNRVELSEQEAINPDYHLTVATTFDGGVSGRYFLRVSSDVAVAVASRILKEDASQETEEMIVDAIGEFCNIICGNAVAKLAQMGITTDIGPPEPLPALPDVPSGQACVTFPVHLTEGAVDIRFFVPCL
jgi:CheY-specific phosphatase CheX